VDIVFNRFCCGNLFYHQNFKETSLDILKKRSAKDEITKEEFDRLKKELE